MTSHYVVSSREASLRADTADDPLDTTPRFDVTSHLPDPRGASGPQTRKLRVLFMQYDTVPNPGFAVQADLMRFFDPTRVQTHVAYNRRPPHAEGYRPGASVESVLTNIPELRLRSSEFGPHFGGIPKPLLIGELGKSAVPCIRDGIGLAHYIRRHGIDVIHAGINPRDAFYGWWLARMTSAKCLIHIHAKYGDWISRLTRYAMHKVDGVVGVSRWCSEHAQRAGVARDRVFTVLNGVDLDGWSPGTIDGAGVRREFGVQHDTALLAAIAALRPHKGHITLLEALHRVVGTHPNIKLLIVGTEDLGSRPGSYTDELQRLVGALGLEQHVVFTGRRRDVRQIHAAADVFALPTIDDTFGLVFVEAMAMGKPVVAARSGGVPEVVDHGATGLLSRPGDSEELAGNILSLLHDRARARQMGANGRKQVLERFTAKRMADDFHQLYRTLVHGSAA